MISESKVRKLDNYTDTFERFSLQHRGERIRAQTTHSMLKKGHGRQLKRFKPFPRTCLHGQVLLLRRKILTGTNL